MVQKCRKTKIFAWVLSYFLEFPISWVSVSLSFFRGCTKAWITVYSPFVWVNNICSYFRNLEFFVWVLSNFLEPWVFFKRFKKKPDCEMAKYCNSIYNETTPIINQNRSQNFKKFEVKFERFIKLPTQTWSFHFPLKCVMHG